MRKRIWIFIIVIIIGVFIINSHPQRHITFGAAQHFSEFVDQTVNEFIIQKRCITIGYNSKELIPNYVGEILTYKMTVGNTERERGFHKEQDLPGYCQTVSKDYTGSNYDRGHMAPAADFRFDKDAMYESFSMANIIPQAKQLNRGEWKDLENYVRNLTKRCDTLYVITGPIIGNSKKKLKKKITIPEKCFKAVIGSKNGQWVISAAWVLWNDNRKQDKEDCMMTIDELESILGRDLFYKVNNEVLESNIQL